MPFRPSLDASPTILRLARFRVCLYFCIGFLNHRLTLLLYNMKLDGINGKGSGKSGAKVYYVNHGVQIEREYNSNVSNPNTIEQIGQRARFKLASQVSAVLAPVIAIPRKGMQSPRNLFVKKNMGAFYAGGDGASVSYDVLQITPGSVPFNQLAVLKGQQGSIVVQTFGVAPTEVKRVIYAVYKTTASGEMYYIKSVVQTARGVLNNFMTTITGINLGTGDNLVVYAYGMIDRTAKATAQFGNYVIVTAEDVARLVANRTLSLSDYIFTRTSAAIVTYDESGSVTPEEGNLLLKVRTNMGANSGIKVKIEVNQGNPIIVTEDVVQVPIGATVKLTCQYDELLFRFQGWKYNGTQLIFALESPTEFTMLEQLDLVAICRVGQGSGGGGSLE